VVIALALLFVVILWIPLYTALIGSITSFEAIGSGNLLPQEFRWQNFIEIWNRTPLAIFFRNSAIYSFVVSFIVLLAAIPASYSMVRFQMKGRSFLIFVFLSTQMVPQIAIGVPMYNVVRSLGLVNTFASVIFVLSSLLSPIAIWLLMGHFKSLPTALEDAAMVDGCSRLQTLLHVLLPAIAPGLASVFIVMFTMVWEQFLIPILLIRSTSKLPITVGVYGIFSDLIVPWNLVMAMTIVSILPPIAVYLFAEKYVVRGLTAGALKG